MLSTFPNLEAINIENNPVKTKNLNNLTAEQFSRLVNGIKDKKIQVNSYKGTVLMDLLEYAQQATIRGNSNPHTAYLQELVQQGSPPKAKVKETSPNHSQIPPKNPNTNSFLLIGGLVLLIVSVLAIGYWLGKRKKSSQIDEFQEF